MLTNQYNNQQFAYNTSWTISDFNEGDKQANRVIRKYINSAIYVEKEVAEMRPQRKTSSLLELDYSRECTNSEKESQKKPLNLLKCTSTKSLKTEKAGIDNGAASRTQKTPESGYRTLEQSENSDSTIKPEPLINGELKLSLTCLNTDRTSTLDPREKQEIVQNWIAQKARQEKRKALKEAKETKRREEERLNLIEKERENFKRWLAEKKKEEERQKAMKELEEEEQKLKEVEKEKKKIESQIMFKLWLRKKRKDDLEKKITEKLALIRMYEEKQKRLEMNELAYQEWLENAKNRQKPIPMNKGLESLCSSASVTYINPIPWRPNIDLNLKPAAQ